MYEMWCQLMYGTEFVCILELLFIRCHFLLLARYVPNVAKEEYMRSV